jgi:hypothetical protein
MEPIEFSNAFRSFIQVAIPTVDAAKLLLLLHERSDEAISLEEAVGRVCPGTSLAEARSCLERFREQGLVAAFPDDCFQYLPDNGLAADVDLLAQAYARRPVTLIRTIYALSDGGTATPGRAIKPEN